MKKDIHFNLEAREKLKSGIDQLANAVKVTLGPKGRNVILDKEDNIPHVTKDGVSIAREINLDDPIENMGAQLIKEAAIKTVDEAGDGTTTSIVLAQEIITAGLKNVAAGANPIDLKRGIDKAVIAVIDALKKQSKAITTNAQIAQVATISANNDNYIGSLIASAVEQVGHDGTITVEESKSFETKIEIIEGLQFDRGHLSPHFITNSEKGQTVLENPMILITDIKISVIGDIMPILETVHGMNKSIFIIAEDIDGEALQMLVTNKLRGKLKVAAVKSPGFGERRKDVLEDIAILTGATVISEMKGLKLHGASIDMLGSANKILITKRNTTIMGGNGSSSEIRKRAATLKKQIASTANKYDKNQLQERASKLSNGVAVLYVGAATEVEMKEKKDRIDDALAATKAAIEEGVVPGGGTAYIRCISALDGLKGVNEDESIGIQIIRKSIEAPLKQIVSNSGEAAEVVIQKVKEGKADFGYNAHTEKYENLLKSGVIDPTKVCRVALENAASVASMLLTTECVVSNKKGSLNVMPTHM